MDGLISTAENDCGILEILNGNYLDVDLETLPMICITPLKQFLQRIPKSFKTANYPATPQLRLALLLRDPECAVICSDPTVLPRSIVLPQNRGRVIKVDTVNQLNGIAYVFITKPLFFFVKINYRIPQGRNRWKAMIKNCAVVVNTRHPRLQPQIESAMRDGLRSMTSHKRYSIELDFDQLLARWIDGVLLKEQLAYKMRSCIQQFSSCVGARIVITNSKEYEHCVDVHNAFDLCLHVSFLPLSWAVCLIYRTQRYVLVSDHMTKMTGIVSYWYLGPHEVTEQESLEELRSLLFHDQTTQGEVERIVDEEAARIRRAFAARRNAEENTDGGATENETLPISTQPYSISEGLPSYEQALLTSLTS